MKSKTKAIIVSSFFGIILLTSTVAIALPSILPGPQMEEEVELLGTPEDNYPPEQRPMFCGSGTAKSSSYVQEYQIPTPCTQPLAITSDHEGNVWFGQVNTGMVSKFNPSTKEFTEFENPVWPDGARSMLWGMDYSPDGSIWYTDEGFDSVWTFDIETKKYQRLNFPKEADTLPQKLEIVGSQIIVNDFTGNKITIIDPSFSSEEAQYLNLASPIQGSVTSDFAVDSNDDLWYTTWLYQQDGVLVKFDYEDYKKTLSTTDNPDPTPFFELYQLPSPVGAPNGVEVTQDGSIWIADTQSSSLLRFDPEKETFVGYPTSPVPFSAYGNASGLILSPVTRPYWIENDSNDNLIFNEQTANRIAVLDTSSESLREYTIPSKNPYWADCNQAEDCGIAQVFGFTVHENKIWFTEWAQNNIGVIDTTSSLPFDIEIDSQNIEMSTGESIEVKMQVNIATNHSQKNLRTHVTQSQEDSGLKTEVKSNDIQISESKGTWIIPVSISAKNEISSGTYKILLGVSDDEIAVSKYLTITVR